MRAISRFFLVRFRESVISFILTNLRENNYVILTPLSYAKYQKAIFKGRYTGVFNKEL